MVGLLFGGMPKAVTMRIDILITGQFPDTLHREKIFDCLYRVNTIFSSITDHVVKIRYHTWMIPDMIHKLVPDNDLVRIARDNIILTRQPKLYNAYNIKKTGFIDSAKWIQEVERLSKKTGDHNNHTLPLMSACDLISTIQRPPDLYIVLQWDSVLSYNFDYTPYINLALKGTVVGFRNNTMHAWHINKRIFELGEFNEELTDPNNGSWCKNVFDNLIMFKPERLDVRVVKYRFKNRILHPRGWGWWQTLCYMGDQPSIPHLNINGVVPKINQIEPV